MAGAILVGGASRRMGSDKALIEVDGVPMAARVAAALAAAGADPVVAVGGRDVGDGTGDGGRADGGELAAMAAGEGAGPRPGPVAGLVRVHDRWPGAGPLGGLAAALSAPLLAGADVVVVAACDQPWLDAATLGALIEALVAAPDAVGAVARTADGRLQLLPGAWRPVIAERLVALVEAGERRLDRAATVGRVVAVVLADEGPLADIDSPEQLP